MATTTRRKPAKKGARASTGAAPRRKLAEYRRKRDFTRTAEPSGNERNATPARSRAAKPLRFVIQKHDASSLHYDLRLELDGVMKSWAVPRGPSLDPSVKRLAMEVEDHPISYNAFEGTIPQGQYGGGTVMLWDRGTYRPADGKIQSLRDGLKDGHLSFIVRGKRIRGEFTLIRTTHGGTKPRWLLFKRTDRYADPATDVTAEETTSVETGRTMAEIARDDGETAPAAERARKRPAGRQSAAKRSIGKRPIGKRRATK